MSSSGVPKAHFISYLKARRLVSKGCVYHIVQVNDFSVETQPIQLDPVVSEFSFSFHIIFLESLLRETDFGIYILLYTQPILFHHIKWIQPSETVKSAVKGSS